MTVSREFVAVGNLAMVTATSRARKLKILICR